MIILRKAGSSLETLKLIRSKMKSKAIISTIPKRDRTIRWGCRVIADQSDIIANKGTAIAQSSNKMVARDVMRLAGISIPPTATTPAQVEGIAHAGQWVHRPAYHHAGKHFKVLDTRVDCVKALARGGYVSVLIEKTHEFRLHVAHGKVLGIQEKPIPPGEHRANMSVSNVPWRVLKREEWKPKMCRMAIEAVDCLNLDFGAVDVICGKGKSEYYVLEVNTAPQISSDLISLKYAKYFDWLARKNRERFDTESKRGGAGFAWTEEDFAA